MRKMLPVVLLGAILEVAWLFGGFDLLRGGSGGGIVGQIGKEVSQVKELLDKARAVIEPPAAPAPVIGDPARNPFALPPGVHLVGEIQEAAAASASENANGAAAVAEKAAAAPPQPPRRELNGILLGARGHLAIIDGAMVQAGDTIDGERVVEVRRDAVVLAQDTRRRTLQLPSPFGGQ